MPVNGALWFIRDLMVMLAFSPLVYWCLRYFRWYILVVFGCIWLVGGDTIVAEGVGLLREGTSVQPKTNE